MEGESEYSADAKITHRIEMLMIAILVSILLCSTSQHGPVLSKAIITLSSLSSPTSTLSVAKIQSLSQLY